MPSLTRRVLNWFDPFAPSNGTVKSASGIRLDPGITFNSPDGMRTLIQLVGAGGSEVERVDAQGAYAAAAYAYVAMRYRASRLAEPPVMVVKEDQQSGDEEWLPTHPMAELLEAPSPDYDMGELLFRTSIYVDRDGHAIWLKEPSSGRPVRLTPFSGSEFTIIPTADSLRGSFKLKTARGEKTVPADQVIYFHEPDPSSWVSGLSRLEVYLGWLNLGQVARATVRDLLANAVWPSVILQPDAQWNPEPKDFQEYKDAADSYSQPGRRGKAMAMLGGGTATVVSARIRDLIPEDILNRVESIAAAVFGIPAIVLQLQVGMENSPWSQMAQARKMVYEDTVEPMWREYEKRLTRQLLRPTDQDVTHLVRFDTSQVRALQADQQIEATVASLWGSIASVNERRAKVGLEPDPDPKADEIPALNPPPAFAGFGNPAEADQPAKAAGTSRNIIVTGFPRTAEEKRRSLWAALRADQAHRALFEWQLVASKQFETDRTVIAALAREHLEGSKAEATPPTPEQRRRFFQAVTVYVEGESSKAWEKVVGPLIRKNADRAMTALASDLGFSFDLLRPELAKYVQREAGFLIKSISDTTRQSVQDALTAGLEAGEGARAMAKRMQDLPAFDRNRALLVARTEATRVTNGAPTEALSARQGETGRRFTKTWSGVLDDRERDEHVALEGETVGIDETFSNGLQFPSEPNCRCVVTYAEVEA
jgi:SPP1 gp7 family putative phage head morphogenesis protein